MICLPLQYVLLVIGALWGNPASATTEWHIQEVYTNADGSIQYIELYTEAEVQDDLHTNGVRLEAQWGTETRTFEFPHDLPHTLTAGRTVLIGSSVFTALPVPPTPDYSPLDGGGIFFEPTATLVVISLVDGTDFVIDQVAFDASLLTEDCEESLNFDPDPFPNPNSPENFTGDEEWPLTCCESADDCPSDGIACTLETCDVMAQTCSYPPLHEACDDDLFCNGLEYCDVILDCQPGPRPCIVPPESDCDETLDMCVLPPVVNSTDDRCDGPECDENDCTPADCTLREAIHRANFDPDVTTIGFDIPGPAPHVIRLDQGEDEMEAFVHPVILDGRTEPDYPFSIRADGFPTPAVVVDGAWTDTGGTTLSWGLNFKEGAADSEMYALSVVDVADIGVRLDGADGTVVKGCMFGQLPDGTAEPNGTTAIRGRALDGVQIGGPSIADRNLIGPSNGPGVVIEEFGMDNAENNAIMNSVFTGNTIGVQLTGDNNVIQGNLIGVDASGLPALTNSGDGLRIVGGASNAVIGNVVSGNLGSGIVLTGAAQQMMVTDNLIGTLADGVTPAGNGGYGIAIVGSVLSTGVSGGVIAHNTLAGIAMTGMGSPPLSNEVTDIAIHDNGGLGIDLGDDGVTPNDLNPPDGDNGPNGLQNFPVPTLAVSDGSNLTIEGTLVTQGGIFRLDFYSSPFADPTGFGEGATFLGSDIIDIGLGPDFSTTLAVAIEDEPYITMTAYKSGTGTSEFSNAIEVIAPVGPVMDVDPAPNRVFEDAQMGMLVCITAFADDPNPGDAVSYSLDDDAGGRFAIGGDSGVVTVADGSLIDHEIAAHHEIDIRATSTDTSFSNLVVTIDVVDPNEPILSDGFEPPEGPCGAPL